MTDAPAPSAEIVNALKAGFAAPVYVPARELADASQGEPTIYARLLGQCLGERAEMVWGASVGEYKASAAAYDEIAGTINATFGEGLVALSVDGGALGIRG